jgi:L-ascorbate metabolism protein UlaG (beta-lactamase superfamily)
MAAKPMNDHHNGKRYFNPTHPADHGFKDVLKFLLTSRNQKWPEWVENRAKPELTHSLTRDQVAITFVNHATVLIQIPGFNILTDPVWSKRVSPLQWLGPKRVRAPGIAFDDLPPIDLVVISHNHYDHLDLGALKKLKQKFNPFFICAKGDQKLLNANGLTSVQELDWWDRFTFKNEIEVIMAPTQHFSSRTPFDRNQSIWGSYQIRFFDHQIYFGGDAAYSTHFSEIKKRLGAPDLALIPIGAYEPRWFMKMIHFGTFQLTEEKIDQPVIDLKAALQAKGLPEKSFITLAEGQTQVYSLPVAP